MRPRTAFSSFLIILATISAAWAAEPTAGKPLDVAVGKTVAAIEDCFNRGDAKSLSALWTPDGDFVGPRGERIAGREKIETAFQAFFAANKNCKLHIAVVAFRPLTDDVALVDSITDMTPAPEGSEGEARSTILLVRRNGRWLVDSIRETVGNTPSHFDRLKDMAWMVGDWTGEAAGSSGAVMHSTCDFTANGSFLIRKFSVGKNGSGLNGTEVIGWDPRTRRYLSWVFESDGGFGASEWSRDGDRWTITYSGVLADGDEVSATQILTIVDPNTLTLQSTERRINGRKRPDVPKVTIKRSPAKETPKPESTEPPKQVLP